MANVSEEAYKEFVATLNIADIKSFLHICDDDVYVAANHTVQSFLKEIDGRWRETVKLGDKLGERYIFVINRSTLEHCTYFDVGLKELVPTASVEASARVAEQRASAEKEERERVEAVAAATAAQAEAATARAAADAAQGEAKAEAEAAAVSAARAAEAATADAASMSAVILAQPLIVFMETPLLYGPYQMNSEEKPQFKSCKVLSKYYDLF